jgi:ankyrin repeat protein
MRSIPSRPDEALFSLIANDSLWSKHDTHKITELINQGASVNVVDENGKTLIHIVAQNDRTHIIETLVRLGVDVNQADNVGATPVHYAAYNGRTEAIETLVRLGADVNKTDNNGKTPIYIAAINGRPNSIETLVRLGADVNKANNDNETSVYYAAENGNAGAIEILVKFGADVKKANRIGKTPLYIAAENGNAGAIEILVKFGANLESADHEGKTPLYIASENGHTQVVKILIANKADINNKYITFSDEDFLVNPIHAAAENSHVEVIKALIEAGVDVDIDNENGFTPLHYASKMSEKTTEELIKAGANVNATTYLKGFTPLHSSSFCGITETMKKLIEAGADVNISDKLGRTPLCDAISKGGETGAVNATAVKTLLSYGANPNQVITSKNFKDLTVLQLAVLNKYLSNDIEKQKQIIQTLFNYGADITVLNDDFFAQYPYQLYYNEDESPNNYENIPISSAIKEFIASLNNQESIARRDQELIELNKERDANIARVAEFVAQKKAKEHQLIDAINSANIAEIKRLVEQEKVNVNFFNESKQNPLLVALENKNLSEEKKQQVIQTLLSFKALLNRSLYLAVVNDKSELIDDLLLLGADIKIIRGTGNLIENAVVNKSLKSITKLLELGFDINKKYKSERTLLHLASQSGHSEVVELLIEKGASVNVPDEYDQTPLHLASQSGHSEVVELLIEKGASVNVLDQDGENPLHIASQSGHSEVVKLLIEKGLDVNALNEYNRTPLHLASRIGYSEVVELLIENKADFNIADKDGETPLYHAFNPFALVKESSSREVIKTLFFAGVDLIKFDKITDFRKFIETFKNNTTKELSEIKKQPEKLEKIQKSGFYALLKIINLQCDQSLSEEQKQSFAKRKQTFLQRILLEQPQQANVAQQGEGGIAQDQLPQLELEFLKFPPIINILESEKFSAEIKLKIIEAIAEEPEQFKQSSRELRKIKIASKNPIISSSSGEISQDNQKLILTKLLSDKISELDFFKDSDNTNETILTKLVEVLLERPSSQIKPDSERKIDGLSEIPLHT